MTDNTNRAAQLSRLMAATSVLALALGMTAQAADSSSTQDKHNTTTTTQIKGNADQGKLSTEFLKLNSNQQKCDAASLKYATNQLKYECNQHKGESTQIKLDGVSAQHKHAIPSTELNPQPEPPKPNGTQH